MSCINCDKEEDFVLEDGTKYCAKCMEIEAREYQKLKECPICGVKVELGKYLFHIKIEHGDEVNEAGI